MKNRNDNPLLDDRQFTVQIIWDVYTIYVPEIIKSHKNVVTTLKSKLKHR